jgi:starvation-inducible outer membrane lipoprotein
MKPLLFTLLLLLTGCATPDVRLAKENADLKEQRSALVEYVKELLRHNGYLNDNNAHLAQELAKANGRYRQ